MCAAMKRLALALGLCALAASAGDLLKVKSKYAGEDKPDNGVWRFTGAVEKGGPVCVKCSAEEAAACVASKAGHADYCTVHYNSAEEQAAARVRFDRDQGKWLDADGAPLDTRARVQSSQADGTYFAEKTKDKVARWGAAPALWAMDAEGNLYVSAKSRPGTFHHSSILGGAKVICAGTIDVVDGKILHIDNASGHYQPPAEALAAAIEMLKKQGAPEPPSEIFKPPK